MSVEEPSSSSSSSSSNEDEEKTKNEGEGDEEDEEEDKDDMKIEDGEGEEEDEPHEEHPDQDPEAIEETGGEAQLPRVAKEVHSPSWQERQEHRKFHLPYRSWCKICVTSRGKDHAHQSVDRSRDGIGIVGIDYFFIGDENKGTTPAVAARESMSKALMAHVIPGKGCDIDLDGSATG